MDYRRLAQGDSAEAAAKEIGFESVDDVASFLKSSRSKYSKSPRTVRARHLMAKLEGAGRDAVSFGDPAAGQLRHAALPKVDAPFGDAMLEDTPRHVCPDSIQSSQSPAAYLHHIHTLSQDEIIAVQSAFGLDGRRPDLKNLVLSKDNLDEEVTTLSLVNEILTAQLIDKEVAEDEAALTALCSTALHPLALPFHQDNAVVREALAVMGGLSLDGIADGARPDGYALSQPDYSLMRNAPDRLRLYEAHVALLENSSISETTVYGEWFGLNDTAGANAALQGADAFMAATGLDFEAFRALVRDDVNVEDEAGRPALMAYVEFLAGGWEIRLVGEEDDEGGWRYHTEGCDMPGSGSFKELDVEVHGIQNKCIRLHQRTGLAFHDLDRLLTTAYLGRDDEAGNHDEVLRDGSGLNVLAHYFVWKDRYGLSVDEFVALLRDINPYRRLGTSEITLMRRLFGDDAGAVTANVLDPETPVTLGELDGDGDHGHLGAILRRGLTLSRAEWDAVLAEVGGGADDVLDALLLGRIYRLPTLVRTLGWDVVEGIALLRAVDADLLATLAGSQDCTDVLSAMDGASWLADWLATSAFTPLEVITVMTAPDEAALYPNQDLHNWVAALQREITDTLVTAFEFTPYVEWETTGGGAVTIREDEWLSGLETAGVLDDRGLMITADRDDVWSVVETILQDHNVDLEDALREDRAEALADRLVGKAGAQVGALAKQVVQQVEGLSEEAVMPLLRWAGREVHVVLKTFLDWDLKDDPENAVGLELLFDIHRYALVVGRLTLSAPEVALAADRPGWLGAGMERALSLRQVWLLSRFKDLQGAGASANDWLAYFAMMEEAGGPEARERLAYLLDWPVDDIGLLVGDTGELGIVDGQVATIEQAEWLARRIVLCREMSISAAELIAFEAVTGVAADGEDLDWAAAAAAVEIGLGQFEGGVHAPAARGCIDEELRDALVGLFMTQVVAEDDDLKDVIKTDENLYEYLLLDVKVSSEVPTTRLLEATGSVQLYINRALEDVERAVFNDKPGLVEVWGISSQYRVWEANEKLKLYPSNYIEPELRQGKSELFTKFEQDITQGELDEDMVEAAIHGYVAGLEKLSELRPHGFFYTEDAQFVTYHFTARADWEKHGWYYRRLDIDRARLADGSPYALRWSDWRKAALPVAAEHVYGMVPAYAWNRLFLFWFELEEKTETVDTRTFETKTRYYLRPKYCRQNLDGSFSDPWSPTFEDGVDLEVTNLILEQGVKRYDPLVYQPYYSGDMVLLYFRPDADGSNEYVWKLSDLSSLNEISVSSADLEEPEQLPNYNSLPHGLNAIKQDNLMIVPVGQQISTGKFAVFSDLDLIEEDDEPDLNNEGDNYGEFSFKFKWTFNPLNETTFEYSVERWGLLPDLPNCAIFAGMREDLSSIGLDDVKLSVLVNDEVIDKMTIQESIPAEFRPLHEGTEFLENNCFFTKKWKIDGSHSFDFASSPEEGTIRLRVESAFKTDDTTPRRIRFESLDEAQYYLMPDSSSHLFYRSQVRWDIERYLLRREEAIDGAFLVSLFSTGIKTITSDVTPELGLDQLFTLDNQQPSESGVADFIGEVEESNDPDFGEVQDPKPPAELDFNGPFGLYAWELFFHIPMMIAARYGATGDYKAARGWLHKIYNPQASRGERWGVLPLVPLPPPFSNSVDSYTIADPDRLAIETPAHYRLAVLRHYLRVMIEQGDALYRQATTESLRQAKMWYVSAKSLFAEEQGEAFTQSTRDDWSDPALGSVDADDFRPPYNAEIRDAYESLEARLDNLRHWRTIDGELLNIPLLAAPVDPRRLQQVALSATATSETVSARQAALPYTFETALAKAKEAVNNLMYFGDLLSRGLYLRDRTVFEELQAMHAHHIALNLEQGGQWSLVESLKIQRDVLQKEKQEAQAYLDWHREFADELSNEEESYAIRLLKAKISAQGGSISTNAIAAPLDTAPNVFGFAVGGSKWSAIANSAAYAMETVAEMEGTAAEIVMANGGFTRRQQEHEMERDAAKKVVERINKEIERLEWDISQEEGTLEQLKIKSAQTENMIEFHRRRTTNREFFNWYVGRLGSLYDSAYDITWRFCCLAERAYQIETGDPNASFMRPAWDARHRGLLSGQSLMLDLQRMDLAYMEHDKPEEKTMKRISLGEHAPTALEGLKQTGRALFTLDEALFDEDFPDEYERRIKSVRVGFEGLDDGHAPRGRLALVGHKVRFERDRKDGRAAMNVFGRQQIALTGPVTDTAHGEDREGRFRPFERCGVDSSWMLTFPGAVAAIEAKKKNFNQKQVLDDLNDVIIDVTYTART